MLIPLFSKKYKVAKTWRRIIFRWSACKEHVVFILLINNEVGINSNTQSFWKSIQLRNMQSFALEPIATISKMALIIDMILHV